MPVVNRIASALLGLLAFVAGLAVAVFAVLLLVNRTSWLEPVQRWAQSLSEIQVTDQRVLWTSLIALVVGLIALIAQFRRVPPSWVSAGRADRDWSMPRRRVERRVAAAVDQVPGVSHTKVAIRGQETRWRVAVNSAASRDRATNQDLELAARGALERLGASPSVPVKVSTHAGGLA